MKSGWTACRAELGAESLSSRTDPLSRRQEESYAVEVHSSRPSIPSLDGNPHVFCSSYSDAKEEATMKYQRFLKGFILTAISCCLIAPFALAQKPRTRPEETACPQVSTSPPK